MASSKEIFALRKTGHLDEAYAMANEMKIDDNSDIWDKRALAWVLIDLIKRDFRNINNQNIRLYHDQLKALTFESNVDFFTVFKDDDELLRKQQAYALSMCQPNASQLFKARNLSKQGKYEEAIELYKSLLSKMSEEFVNDYGWTLYKYCKLLIDQEKPNIPLAKAHMVAYLKLPLKRPSKLHSTFLWLAHKLAKDDQLNMARFLPYWGLENLSSDDFSRLNSDKGELHSLGERIIQQAVKKIVGSPVGTRIVSTYIPILKKLSCLYPDNIWLNYYLAKIYVYQSEFDDARRYCKEICKQKPSEFWAWSLLGDSYNNHPELQMLFYANALTLQSEEIHSEKLYLKFSKTLLDMGHGEYAKYIIETVFPNPLTSKYANDINNICSSEGYIKASRVSIEQYNEFCSSLSFQAKKELIADLPWLRAIIGEKFNVSSEDNQKLTQRRKIYVEIPNYDELQWSSSYPQECVLSEKRFPLNSLEVGTPIAIKGEELSGKNFQIFDFSNREDGTNWDIFTPVPGLINYINTNKNVYHIILDQDHPKELFFSFNPSEQKLKLYDSVEVFIAESNKYGTTVAYLIPSDRIPSDKIFRKFENERIDHLEQFAFTESNYFVPPDLVKKSKLDEYTYVISYYEKDVSISGKAVLNYNKKKSSLTWKVISIAKINAPENLEDPDASD